MRHVTSPDKSLPGPRDRRCRARPLALASTLAILSASVGAPATLGQDAEPSALEEASSWEFAPLDGFGNNLDDPTLGQVGQAYPRVGDVNYADGIGEIVEGPPERYLSNRIFNGSNQNIFSESVSHWAFVWGQFIDHNIGLRADSGESIEMDFDPEDPLESFTNDLGGMRVARSAVVDGTGTETTREQMNTVSSYLDAWAIYGGSEERLDWLREGELDGDPTNNSARLIESDGYLPTAEARSESETPTMETVGHLMASPSAAAVAGDMRANENLGLLGVQTLFMREHNRIVDELPESLDEETRFQIARRVVSALLQYITYNEYLPAMGVELEAYNGYDALVDPSITNEFATVGYRAHSMVHGEFEAEFARDRISAGAIEALRAQGVDVEIIDGLVEVAIPLNVAYGNPGLLPLLGLGNLLTGLSSEAAYANDEQIDNQLRSVLFQIPGPDVTDPSECLDGDAIAQCFSGVTDLGAIDVWRSYDHGMPPYNDMREAYGLPRVESFTELTGELSEEFPDDPEIDRSSAIDDPDILDFVSLANAEGNLLEPGSDEAEGDTVTAVRRTTTAARLKAIFGDVDAVDAFTGMISAPHVDGTEFGELQLAMWEQQFTALRDGDRFFYANDPILEVISEEFGIDYRRTLAEVIAANTDVDPDVLQAAVFEMEEA